MSLVRENTRRRVTMAAAGAAMVTIPFAGYAALADTTAGEESAASFQVGYTHTDTAFPFGDDAATDAASAILADTGPLQNQHLMGWGTSNPWPDPNGDFDFSSMDERIEAIEATNGTPVITLCSAPGWMKPSGEDWNMNEAPLPEYYDDYARLAAATAERYPQVEYFQVWNEFKGFWNGNELAYEEYTEFYNQVYRAVREVRPDAELGGPYVSLRMDYGQPGDSDLSGDWGEADQRDLDAVSYWLENNVGADFFTLDAWTLDHDGDALADEDQIRQMFADVTSYFADTSGLPVWWSEYYAPLSGPKPGDDVDPTTPAAVTAALEGMRDGGAAVALWWQPECSDGPHPCVFTDTSKSGGGQPTEFTPIVERFSGR